MQRDGHHDEVAGLGRFGWCGRLGMLSEFRDEVAEGLGTARVAEDDVPAGCDGEAGLALLRLVQATPALCVRLREKQVSWRPDLADGLTERSTFTGTSPLAAHVRVAAALDCLTIALEHWVGTDGRFALGTITDEAFAVFAAR